jgi:uncharacterized membrane protein YdfJ with MMPL/SSD domain
MRTRLLAVGLAIIGLLSAGVAAAAVWRRMGREASELQHEPIRPPAIVTTRRQLPPDLEPHPTGIFAALGRFDYRFRRVLPIIGLAAVIGLNIWASQAGGRLIQGGWVIEGSEEQQAAARLADRFGEQATTMLVVFEDPQGDAARSDFQDIVTETLEPIEDDPLVDEITTYAGSLVDELLSEDGAKTLAVITLSEDEEDAVEGAAALTEQVRAPSDVDVLVTGIPQLYHEFNGEIEDDLVQAELISLPVALVILLAVFGTLVGAVLPLLIAGMALPSAFAIVNLLAGVTDVSVFVTNLASMIGLALAIDYSLFMVSRYREELRHHSVEVAIERMMGSVGKAVAVSGVAVAIGLSSLTVFEAAALRSMGVGGVITVVSTLLFALTVLPALMALLGPRVNRLRIPLPGPMRLVEDDTSRADARQGHGVWAWIAARVMRRPILIALPVLGLLLLAGSPFLSIELSTGQNLQDLPETPAREAFLLIEEEFPGGESDPIVVAITYDDAVPADEGLSLEQQDELATYVD